MPGAERMPILVLGTMGDLDSRTSAQLEAMGVVGAHILPPAVSAGYRLEIALGASIAVIFLLAYFALVALVAWAVWSIAPRGRPPAGLFVIVVGGCLLFLSLLKPLVARPGRTAEPHSLDPDQGPLLFAFVRELASASGTPGPERIVVDCNVNCCCVFAGGIAGLFRSAPVLLVGLPLVSGLRLGELGGVVAHELAHSAQTKAMQSSRFLWGVHAWFSRVALEPDKWDEQLLKWIESAGPIASLASRLTQLLFRLGRGALGLLAVAEGAAVSIFLRRMELEADRCQARVAGTGAFVSTALEINLLALAAQRAIVELSRMKRNGRLVDNYPGLIAAVRERYSKQFVQRVQSGLEARRTGWFGAHPSDNNRIALAREENCPGIVTAGLPSAMLFADYDALCRQVTLEFYDQEFCLKRTSYELVPLQSIVDELESVS
ncbi:MAG TPA: M48 family metalloprotease [Verrucomicrobiae bacterium]|nr:M48 family metalloprotease [Verrucomicrobiae bacterium]